MMMRKPPAETPVPETVAEWHSEHMQYARLLDILDEEIAAFHAGEQPDYELLRDAVHYLRYFPDRYHHPREDIAFRRLVQRDPAMALPVNRLLQEHRVIAAAGDGLLARLEEVAQDILIARSAVEATAATFLVYYRHHIATEENEVLPRAARLLKASDWAAVAGAVSRESDPLFGGHPEPGYRELRRRIALGARARTVDQLKSRRVPLVRYRT